MRTKLLNAILIAAFLFSAIAVVERFRTRNAFGKQPPPQAGNAPSPESSAAPRKAPPSGDGQTLIHRAVSALGSHYTVSAEVTQTANLLGQEMIGSGSYFEQRSNQGLRFRLELNAQTSDDKRASGLVQVCDGQYLWSYRKLRGSESLSRVDLTLVQQRLDEVGAGSSAQILDGWPGMGGLAKLLQSYDRAFLFDTPEEVQLQSSFPAWKVEGRWRPEMLARAVPRLKDAIKQGRGVAREDLPEHLPNSVVLFLGKDDLFPYSIFYYRLEGTTADVKASPDDRQIVQIILSEVRFNQSIPAGKFVYNPQLKFSDETEQLLAKLGVK